MAYQNLVHEFDRQIQNLIQKGYPQAASSTSTSEFLRLIEPLRGKISQFDSFELNLKTGTLPFVIVVKNTLIASETTMGLVTREGNSGITKLNPLTASDFTVIDTVSLPENPVYLLTNIDRGRKTLNVPPQVALKIIQKQSRSPITIDEGIAIITHYPDFLLKNNCFSLLASRHAGDKKVTAIWINQQKNPHLGWCWDGNPHTWLGSASCSDRL